VNTQHQTGEFSYLLIYISTVPIFT